MGREKTDNNSIEFRRQNSEGETPGPIPNPEAKPFSADGTALVTVWESRTQPDTLSDKPRRVTGGVCRISGPGPVNALQADRHCVRQGLGFLSCLNSSPPPRASPSPAARSST